MKFRLGNDVSLSVQIHDAQRCQFGIGEAIGAAVGGSDLLGAIGSLFGIGGAAAAPAAAGAAETGLATIGADAAGLGADAGLAGITGTGTALAGGGATGLAGTALAGGSGLAGDALLGAGATGGALGTAASFIDSPLASGFNPAALTGGIDAPTTGAAAGVNPGSVDVFGATPSATSGVANVGPATSSPITGLNSTVGPAGPAAPSAAVAPAGAGSTDLTSGAAGPLSSATTNTSIPGASGYTSVGGAPLTGGTATGSGGLSGIVDNALGKIGENPLSLVGPAAGLGGLAYTVSQANKQLPEQTSLNAAAQTATAQGNQLSSYLLNGTLPAGLQTTLNKATQDAKTAAISNAAKSGQPTDPSQNSTLAAELAQIDQQATISTAQIGQQLLTSGLSETQLASQDYSTLLSADQTEQSLISNAIGNFAKSLGGLGTSGLKLNIGT